jgi:hypothetical protein
VPLEQWLPDATLQASAAENNLAETAFFVSEGAAYALRWFCGHAPLASAYVIFRFLDTRCEQVDFRTLKAGTLSVKRQGDAFAMDFPSRPAGPVTAPATLAAALGKPPALVLAARDDLAVYERAEDVAALTPDFAALARLDRFAELRRCRAETASISCRASSRRRKARRGSGDRLLALHADALLGDAARQDAARGAADVAPRRRADLHARRRARGHGRALRALSRGRDHPLGAHSETTEAPFSPMCEADPHRFRSVATVCCRRAARHRSRESPAP